MAAGRLRQFIWVANRCAKSMKLEDALNELKARRKARRLRNLWPVIQARLADGVTHAEILDLLNANGFELTERTYLSYVYRLRKRRRERASEPQYQDVRTPRPFTDARQGAVRSADTESNTPARPPTFDFDPAGLSPHLLK